MRYVCIIFFLFLCITSSLTYSFERISNLDIVLLLEQARERYEVMDYEYSIKYYEKALKIDSSNPRVQFGLASCYLALEKYSLSIEHFEKVLELNPAIIEAYFGLSIAYNATGNSKLSISYYRKGLGLDIIKSKNL